MRDRAIHKKLDAALVALERIEAALHPCEMHLSDNLGHTCRQPSTARVGGAWLCERHRPPVLKAGQ